MPHSKYRPTPPGSDESLYRMMNLSLGSCQGYNWEAMMLQEALATTTQPREEKKPNSGQIILFEIVMSLIFIGVAWLVGNNPQTSVVDTPTDIHHASQHQERYLINRQD